MEYQLDLTAYRCPLPLLMIKKALATLAKGDVLWVTLAEHSSVEDIRLLCSELGYEFQSKQPVNQTDKRLVFAIFLQ